jgi:1-acyl-sn-glycerol-3-phosphate acyltransferase
LLKIWVGLAMKVFCRKVVISHPEKLKLKGPLILACNHPNSFLDAIILDVLFDEPLHPLARGDIFKNPIYAKLLKALRMLPVYRVSEGAEYLTINYDTFEDCKAILRNNGVVLIFVEGRCINEWRLRPLKKGAARLAFSSWEQGVDVQVLPIGINYSSFRRFGKNVFLHFGNIISRQDIAENGSEGKRHLSFNQIVHEELKNLVYEIPSYNKLLQEEKLVKRPSALTKILLAAPAAIGWLIHAPLYIPLRSFVFRKTSHNDHYDAVLTALLVFLYPFYILLIALMVFAFSQSWLSFLLLIGLPFTAWGYVQLKEQLD